MKVRGMTLAQFNKDYGSKDSTSPLYVLNRSNPNGQVVFNSINELNQTIPVLIPATFIPVDLTTQIPLETLLKSAAFRSVLGKKQLVIAHPGDAEKYLATERGRNELNRISSLIGSVKDDGEEIEIDLDAESTSNKRLKSKNKQSKKEVAPSAHDDFIAAMIDRCNDEDEDDEKLQREFLTHQPNLTYADLELLRREVTRSSIIDLILEAMQELDNEEEEEDDE